uniref:Uncharacterized protein n=1 Tax=Magallana gigas TaxID=29159 RepID=A0A8W8MNW1_MAGGI
MFERKKVDTEFKTENIRWMLTVPAIYEEPAKQFMRLAAREAGIEGDNLLLALEPEAASIYVKEMNVEVHTDMNQSRLSDFSPKTKYMIAARGTVDVTVREVLPDRSLKEITKASGGAWGGLHVNQRFYQFIEDMVGNKLMEKFRDQHPAAQLDLERKLEQKKRNLSGDKHNRILINLPDELIEFF